LVNNFSKVAEERRLFAERHQMLLKNKEELAKQLKS